MCSVTREGFHAPASTRRACSASSAAILASRISASVGEACSVMRLGLNHGSLLRRLDKFRTLRPRLRKHANDFIVGGLARRRLDLYLSRRQGLSELERVKRLLRHCDAKHRLDVR